MKTGKFVLGLVLRLASFFLKGGMMAWPWFENDRENRLRSPEGTPERRREKRLGLGGEEFFFLGSKFL